MFLLLFAFWHFGGSIARAQTAPEDAPIEDVAPGDTAAPNAAKPLIPAAKTNRGAPTSDASKSASPDSAVTKATPPQTGETSHGTPKTVATSSAATAPEDTPIDDIAPGENSAVSGSTAPVSPGAASAHTTENSQVPAPSNGALDAEIAVPAWWNVPASFAPGFMRQALLSGVVVALLCGYLSVFVVLKRIAFVGVALSQVCSAGVALGFLWGFSPQLGAFAFMLAGVALFAWSPDPRRVPRESYIGAVYAVAGACGVLLIALNASGESTMLDLLQGDILAGDVGALKWLIGVFALLAIAHATFQKEWVLVSFDREAANTLGFPAVRWDFFLFLTVGIAIALSIRAVGALLTSALLILPGATALLLCSRLRGAFWMAPLLTIIPVILGLHASFVSTANAPPSALIAALLFAVFLIALGWRTLQGRLRGQ